jgi:hypothetical protein
MAVWKQLQHASELVVAVHRNGRPRTLRYDIVD